MDIETFERLKVYEDKLFTAYKLGYARNVNERVRNDLVDIYRRVFNEEPYGAYSSCNTCLFNMLKRLATVYFPFKDEIEVQKQYYDSPTEPIEAAEEPQDAEPIEAAEAPKAQQTQNKAPKTRRKKTDGNK